MEATTVLRACDTAERLVLVKSLHAIDSGARATMAMPEGRDDTFPLCKGGVMVENQLVAKIVLNHHQKGKGQPESYKRSMPK